MTYKFFHDDLPPPTSDFNIISINSFDEEFLFKKESSTILSLKFDDIEFKDLKIAQVKQMGLILFSMEDAKRIIEFLNRIDRSKILICHCSAGVSRSGAVGRFANEMINRDSQYYKFFYDKNGNTIFPNGYIYKILIDVWEWENRS